MRRGFVERNTLETKVKVKINLDGSGKAEIDSGIGFLDHMLTLFTFHSKFDLTVKCRGDLQVDDHHTIEDLAICLGQSFKDALGEKIGIKRYSTVYIPMDESLAYTSVDISNRPYLVFNVNFKSERIGSMSTQMFKEFFSAFVNESRITLHINLIYGENDHHKIEAVFKSFARALREGSEVVSGDISSSKGVL
ncbi:imidazoleglycerol-phosphate dehydratase HisB [Terrisporobacter petrolearius]|uniref:imidazoleglycerol-phosphate dehydratase HisB n=1 Tax=Terrisporobacter petrolearius TaxID=1460447 RepID=UPI003AFFCFF9